MATTTHDGDQVTEVVARAGELTPGTMRMVTVGGQPVALVTTERGTFALDNACPHQGYGLVTGTCRRDHHLPVAQLEVPGGDGVCTFGEEDVGCHPWRVADDGAVVGRSSRPPTENAGAGCGPASAGAGRHYTGQVARDAARLLEAGATPAAIMRAGAARAAPGRVRVEPRDGLAADALVVAESPTVTTGCFRWCRP